MKRNQHTSCTVLACILCLLCCPGAGAEEPAAESYPCVVNAGLVAPDILCLEIHEGHVNHGQFIPYEAQDGDTKKPFNNNPAMATVVRDGTRIGDLNTKLNLIKIYDTIDGKVLDRTRIREPSFYKLNGGTIPVKAVCLKTLPLGNAHLPTLTVVFRHFCYLHLDKPLPQNSEIEIQLNDPDVSPYTFQTDTKQMRTEAIHVNQVGYGLNDASRKAYLSTWLGQVPDDGDAMVDYRSFDGEHGFSLTFEILDAQTGKPVFSGPITLRSDGINPPKMRHGNWKGAISIAGTHVFEMDFSAGTWTDAKPGSYRIHVPGLGCSYAFHVAQSAWQIPFRYAMQGLYHHRSGIELDGRYGYKRPRDFHPDDGNAFVYCTKPLMSCGEGLGGPFKPKEHIDTTTQPAVVWGGYHDAGDWDRRIQHSTVPHALFLLYELFPDHFGKLDLNLPSSREFLEKDLYGVELPDILDEAVWNVDFYRRMQTPEGGVHGGIQEQCGANRTSMPSWSRMHTSHLYAPGPWASYLHAAQAAQGAHVLRPLNARLATVYRESAARAWQWAEGKMADQDYVRQMIPKANEQRIREGIDAARAWAAAELYRLTGEESYKTAFVKQLGVDPTNKRAAQFNDNKIRGVISYVLNKNVPDDDPLKVYLKRSFVETSHNDFLKPMKNYPYSVLRHSWAPFGYGNGTTPGAQHYLRIMLAYVLTGDRDALAGTCDSGSFILGANQANTSMITGLGQRPVRNPHHEDMANMGVAAPNGIVVYGFATHEYLRRYHWVFYPKWAMLSEKVPEKSLVPTSFGWPPYECFFDTFGIMVMTEYTIQQSMTPCALMYGLLDALAHGHKPKTVQR